MTDLIKIIVSAVGGAIVGGFFNVWLQKVKNQGSNEGVYADHTKELFERVDKLTDERDDLKEQVISLQSKIDDQNDTINDLKVQIKTLNNKFDKFEGEEINGNN